MDVGDHDATSLGGGDQETIFFVDLDSVHARSTRGYLLYVCGCLSSPRSFDLQRMAT